jgi:pimeloyl-ACP methyl ester carboxylesterase
MPSRLATALAVLLLVFTVQDVVSQEGATGHWHGVIDTPRGPLRLAFTLTSTATGLAGVMESVDQAPGQQIPLAAIAATDSTLTFLIPSIGASYEARWDASDSQWKGVFLQGAAMPLSLARGVPPRSADVAGMDGNWQGSLERNGVALRLLLRVSSTSSGTTVRLDSPDMLAADLVVEGFQRTADSIRFRVPAAGAAFDGSVSADGQTMIGAWSRPPQPSVQVVFNRTKRSDSTAPRRTQWPLLPGGYTVDEVSFSNPDAPEVTLSGTVTLPKGPGPFPAVVLISGSGPQDRDGTMFGHKPFAVLADHLTRQGIAVLRYDDRGVGGSSGDHASATSADFATDARAAVEYLRSRADIAPAAIGLAGHSEGGMIGPMAAADNEAVAFLVLLAGPGTPVSEMLLSQRRLMGPLSGLSPEYLAATEPHMRRVFAAASGATDQGDAEARIRAVLTTDVLQALGMSGAQRDAFVAQFSGPWFRYFLGYDPARVLAQIRVPVLAIGGSLDLQVPSGENLSAIASALAGNADVTVEELPGLNHFFQPALRGAASEYEEIAESFSPVAMERITRWIHERFCTRPAAAGSGAVVRCIP